MLNSTSSRRRIAILGASILAFTTGCAKHPQPGTMPSLYERVAARLANRTDLEHLGQPPPELEQVAWMLGTWNIEVQVFATASTPEQIERGASTITTVLNGTWLQMADSYPGGTQDLGFLTFNSVTKQWVSLAVDSNGNALSSYATGWEGDHLALVAEDVEIIGERTTLRQSLSKISNDEYVLLNEERMPDGRWVALDEYHYRRAR